MRFLTLLSTALMVLSPAAVFAGGKTCTCTKKCMTQCKQGKGEKCTCKACECKHDKKCGEGEGACKAGETKPEAAAPSTTEEKK